MTPRIPLSRCKRCVHYRRETCQLPDLNPCNFVETAESKDRRFRTRYGLWNTAIVIVLLILLLVLNGCRRAPEPQPVIPKWSTMELLRQQHKGELSEYDKLILAIAFTESRWNPDAVGKNGDLGFLQITPVYVREANKVSGANFKHEDAFSIDSSLAMFQALQSVYNPTKDIHLGIYFHNKSAAYERAVLENLKLIERYENLRAKLVELHDK